MHRFTRTVRTGLFLGLVSAILACSPSTPTLVTYERSGVTFSHYADWAITGDVIVEKTTGSRIITIEGPNDTLVSIILLPAVTQWTLEEFAKDAAEGRVAEIKKSLPIGSSGPAKISAESSQVVSGEMAGKKQNGIRQTFNITLLGVEVPHEARFFVVSAKPWSAFIMTQVTIEDAGKVEPGFAAMLRSFQMGKAE